MIFTQNTNKRPAPNPKRDNHGWAEAFAFVEARKRGNASPDMEAGWAAAFKVPQA